MKTISTDKADMLFKQVDQILDLPLSEYHQLKLILRKTMETLHADRCWLMYPCDPTSEQFLIPIEETTKDYPGANLLKVYAPINPIYKQIAEKASHSSEPVEYDLTDKEVAPLYHQFKIKSQLGCQIRTEGKPWAFGVHHCETQHCYTRADKRILTEVSHKISRALNQLLDIPRLLSATELSTEMLNNNPLAQVIYNADRELVYANEAYCELNGRQLDNIINQHGKQYLKKSNQHLFDTFFTQIEIDGFATAHGQKDTGDGRSIWVENYGNIINYNGERHFLISSKDITAETDAINALNNMVDVQNAILEATDDGILVEDVNRKIISINQNIYQFFNIEPPKGKCINTLDLLSAGIPMIVNAEEIGGLVTQLAATSAQKNEVVIQLTNGTILELNSFPLIHQDTVKGRVWYFKNITAQVKSTQALENALDIHRAIMEASDDGLLVEDRDRKLITLNQVFIDTFKLPENFSADGNITALDTLSLGLPMMSDPEEVGKMVSTIVPTSDERVELLVRLIDGRVLDVTSLPLINNDNIHGRVWYFKDITKKHNLTSKLSFEATHDPLTTLINRRGFDEILQETIQQTADNNDVHALLYLDLDRFKIINDSAGHSAGDIALIEVGKLLGQLLRKTDSLARVGGDEFCILLDNSSLKVAEKIAEKIRHAIEEYVFKWEDKGFNIGVSIGIVSIDATVNSYEEALNLADTSCYLAKDDGRNCIHIHTTSDQAVIQGNIVSQIQGALKTDRFTCFVQKICSTTAAIESEPCTFCNYEVLVRMLDNKGNIIALFVFYRLPNAIS